MGISPQFIVVPICQHHWNKEHNGDCCRRHGYPPLFEQLREIDPVKCKVSARCKEEKSFNSNPGTFTQKSRT